MPESVIAVPTHPKDSLLSFEEIQRFVRVATTLGIDKIRLTGGEPLLRRDLPRLVEMLAGLPGIKDVGVTTNGILLAPMARDLWNAGLRRINVSLDTMDPGALSRTDAPGGVREGNRGDLGGESGQVRSVEAQRRRDQAGRRKRTWCRSHFAREHGLELPVHRIHAAGRREPLGVVGKVLFAAEILEILEQGIGPLTLSSNHDPRAPAMDYDYVDGGGRVGMIASVSRPFCMSCNRVRLTAEGKLRNCLFAPEETDVKAASFAAEAPVTTRSSGRCGRAWRRSGKGTKSTQPGSSSRSG